MTFDEFRKLIRELIDLLLGHHHGRVHLHLKVKGPKIMNVGDTAVATITPTAAGAPAIVTNVVYDSSPSGFYTVVPASDGLSAVYTAVAAGTGISATVSAVNTAGVTLNDRAPLPDVTVIPVPGAADKLNLVITLGATGATGTTGATGP